MRYVIRNASAAALAGVVAVGTAACEDFVEVRTPGVVDAEEVDPVEDGATFSQSAFQNFIVANGHHARITGWFTTEAWVGDTFPTRNQFGRRDIDVGNGTMNGSLFFPLSQAVSTGDQVVEDLGAADVDGPENDLNMARGAFSAGMATQLIAETFCEAPLRQPGNEEGPALQPDELVDEALDRLALAQELGEASGTDEGGEIALAAQVAIARGHLQAGRNAEALAAAQEVPEDFRFDLPHVDQLGERTRLGNHLFLFSDSGSRRSLVVGEAYREMGVDIDNPDEGGDPRIPWSDPDSPAQDGTLNMYTQEKFPGWDAPQRLASGLEARYIAAEASGDVGQQLALINERREVGGQPEFDSDDPETVLEELLNQRHRDFWLEGKRMGDFRRHGLDMTQHMLGPDDEYYKPAVGSMSNDQCFPIPQDELDANPNL